MKIYAACFGAFGLLALAGPVHQLSSIPETVTDAPSWINLPVTGEVSSISFMGSLGDEASRGLVALDLSEDAEAEVSAMKSRLAANGFIIEEQTTSVDSFMGAANLASAFQPSSGRSLQMVQMATPTGAILRVTFVDKAALVASAE